LHSDRVHLLHEIAAVERAGEDETQSIPCEDEVILEGMDLSFRSVVESVEKRRQEVPKCVDGRDGRAAFCEALKARAMPPVDGVVDRSRRGRLACRQ